MNSQPKWDIYESVVLLNGYLLACKKSEPRAYIIRRVSADLRAMAIHRGRKIDEIFRNENGISYQMQSMDSAYKGRKIYVPATKLFQETVSLYRNQNSRFQELLKEARYMIEHDIAHPALNDTDVFVVDFNDCPDMSFARVNSLTYRGQAILIRPKWRDLYIALLKKLYADYSNEIDSVVGKVYGRASAPFVGNCHSIDYLRAVVATSVNYSAYKKNLFDLILSYSPKSKEYGVFYPQRKELLKAAQDMGINSYLAKSKQRESQRIYYLTDNTEEEQYEIIKEIVSLGAVPKEIVTIFPELNDYLCKYAFGCKNGELLTEYFQEYKTNKLLNRIPNTFLETVKEYSLDGNRKYNVLPTRGSLVEQYNNGKNGMIWIDALGVEFLGYIQRICAKIGLKMDVQIGRAVLPTLTSKNKSFYDEWKGPKQQTKRLDDIKHKGEDRFNYESDGDGKLPLHIVAELKVIKDALYRAKSLLLQEEVRKVIIASDHGASRLAVINEHQSKHTMSDTTGQHSGRCCPLSETDERPDSATSENGFWVLANYDRFGGGRKASVEVHGGATLEEVIVPVIELTLLDSSITMENLTPTVWSSYNENPVLELFCAANVNKMRLRVGDVTYEAEKVSNVKYRFVLDKHKISGPYTAEVLDSDSIIGKISFDIQKRSGEKNSKVEDDFFI